MNTVASWIWLTALATSACTVGSKEKDHLPSIPEPPLPVSGSFGDDGVVSMPTPGWTSIGYGVEYERVNTGNAIVIVYGGYSAHLSYSAGWATELVDGELGANGVGQIYAVQGPQDPSYSAKEIGNSKLRHHMATIDDGVSPIFVIAHSSGSYVAQELLGQMYNAASTSELGRITYACLEGGGTGLTTSIVASLKQLSFVYALDPTLSSGYSENYSAEQSLGSEFAPKATTFEVKVPSTGCDDGAGWCLHDVVVTHRPHNPSTYDLADDYTDFVNRLLTTEYLAPLLPGA
jgi:hypothetical protein